MRAEDVLDAGAIFETHKWSTKLDPLSSFPSAFENYCEMLSRLNHEERALVLTLTRTYRWISEPERRAKLLEAIRKLSFALPSTIRRIVLLPCKKPQSQGPKSSDSVFYSLREYQANIKQIIAPRSLVFCGHIADFKHKNNTHTVLVLVDDYVGSGETAESCIKEIRSLGTNIEILVLAIAAHRSGIIELAKKHCTVIAAEVFHRGINDNSYLTDKTTAIAIMRRLEDKLGTSDDCRFGWKATEGLLTMARTPNNTFPVFWQSKNRWIAPFPR
jgi:hypothetical protein